MLDAALPRFTISENNTIKHHSIVLLSRPHSEAESAYAIHRADPKSPNSRNCYAAGLVDAYHSGILYGEVLLRPRWTQPQPSLSAEEIRKHGATPAPPEPSMPQDFTVQLYNPDQQVVITQRLSQILGTARWEFSMPQDTFRLPSSSALDRSLNDPAADANTPLVNFAWKRESKFSRDLICYLTGKSTNVAGARKKSKEPDIAIAAFKGLQDLIIYEPNLYRVEMEDPKGLEVVILLSAVVLKDVFFARDIYSVFNISSLERGGGPSLQVAANMSVPRTQASSKSPITDPRTQWDLDAETAQLKLQSEAEDRSRRKERERVAEAETRRLQKLVEVESREKERVRREQERQAEAETQRLRKIYGTKGQDVHAPRIQPNGPVMSGAIGRPIPHPPTLAVQNPAYPHPPLQPVSPISPPTQHQSAHFQPGHFPQPGIPPSVSPMPMNHPQYHPAAHPPHFAPPPQTVQGGLAVPTSHGKDNRRRSFLNLRLGSGGREPEDRMRKRSSVF